MKFTLPTFITIALLSGTTSAARSLRGTSDYTLNNASYTTTTDITNSNLPEGNNETKRALVDNVPLPKNIMETKVITNVGVTWETVTLTKAYASPVAVCSVCYTGSQTEPLVVRMRNVVLSSFEIRLQNPGDSITPTSKTVNCLIVEKGKWNMPNGRKIEAQSYTSTSTAAKNAWTGGNQQQQRYLQSYCNPVVLGQVMTFNDPLWSVFFASNGSQDNPPTNNALFTGKHVGEDTNKIRANEIIGFIVMEGGHDASSPIENEASVGSDSVDGYGSSIIGRTYTYQQTFVDIPQVTIVSSAAMDGGDGGWPTLVMDGSQSTDTFQVLIDEDVVGDTERSHTNEQVAYATFSSQGIIPLLSYCFKHVGHCAGGWMGGNTVQPSVASCAEQCRGRAGCGFFAYNGSNCAVYLEANGCPDYNTYNDHTAYYLDCPAVDNGYYMDKRLDEIFLVMTHNSLAIPFKVFSPNQNYGLKRQFDDGIRGFNLDLYSDDKNIVFTHHGGKGGRYNPKSQIDELLGTLKASPNEFILIQLEDYLNADGIKEFVSWFGSADCSSTLITNFDINKPLGYYIHLGKQVLIVTDKGGNVNPSLGMHDTKVLITENEYEWKSCYFGTNNRDYRRGKKFGKSFKLMNSFCSLSGSGDMIASESVNRIDRILYNARRFKELDFSQGNINGIIVDYYEMGNVIGAQEKARAGDFNNGCWGDGKLCGEGTTCWNCCDESEYWYSKALTACGSEPKWSDGTICALGTTCNACQNDATYWWGKAFTACGSEPKWSDGTRCLHGTSCNACENKATWWVGKVGHHCGAEPCWERGEVCGAGTTCKKCCSGAKCPWYQFGVCTCG